jgi:hypothetical protein
VAKTAVYSLLFLTDNLGQAGQLLRAESPAPLCDGRWDKIAHMNHLWFRRWGWIYRPMSWQGWALLAVTIIFCVQAFIAIDRHSHSASDTLYGVFPYFVPAFSILGWIASHTSARS